MKGTRPPSERGLPRDRIADEGSDTGEVNTTPFTDPDSIPVEDFALTVNVPFAVAPPVGFRTVIVLFPVVALAVITTLQVILAAVLVVYDLTETPVPEIDTIDFLDSKFFPVRVTVYVPPFLPDAGEIFVMPGPAKILNFPVAVPPPVGFVTVMILFPVFAVEVITTLQVILV